MSDLISRLSLKDRVSEYALSSDEYERFCKIIDAEPTAYDIDKVVRQLNLESVGSSIKESLGLLRAIEIVKQGCASDDVCEWHKVKNGNAYKCNTHAEIHDSRVLDWCKCPYCGKKIKVVD